MNSKQQHSRVGGSCLPLPGKGHFCPKQQIGAGAQCMQVSLSLIHLHQETSLLLIYLAKGEETECVCVGGGRKKNNLQTPPSTLCKDGEM